jgi:hypothetical protein
LRSKHLSKCFHWYFDGAHGVVPSGAGSLAASSIQISFISAPHNDEKAESKYFDFSKR